MSNLNGKILGERYRLLEKIGEGGMAVVYKAQDTGLGRFVAVKVIRRGAFPPKQIEHILKRFEREARAQAKLSHPNILTIFDYGEFENQPYLVMEYVPHGSLKDLLKGRPISWNRAAPIIASVARALAAAHAQGIIHRDVKPSNILMANGRDPMLADFGIAKLVESDADTSDLTGTGMGIGTPEYMAPEQASGKSIDHRADIYALGIVLYQMVTGRLPFKGDTPLAIMLLKNTQKVPNPRQYSPDLPRAAENILIKALARNPEERFKDMQEFAAALEGRNMVTETVTLDEYPPPGNAKARKGKNQIRPEWIAVGGVLVLCLSMFLGGAFAVGRAISPTEPPTLTSTPSATSSPTNTPGPTPTPTPLPEEFTDDKGAVMRLIPAGEFTMGSNGGDANERPAHQIYLQDYYMDKYEVANALYETCVKAGVCKPPKQARS
ncbi:MAG TPA: protein kinase, partial [Anaerolineales bacterium]|nr:protein kinase [Anaerolineales bacterium]